MFRSTLEALKSSLVAAMSSSAHLSLWLVSDDNVNVIIYIVISTVASFLLWFCPELVEDIILSSQIYVSGLISLFISFISPLFHLLSFRPDHLFHLLCGLLRLLQRELLHGNATTLQHQLFWSSKQYQ